jgi:Mrp family chromosome partitioning ATPase
MTKLDRALIKVYQHRAATAAPDASGSPPAPAAVPRAERPPARGWSWPPLSDRLLLKAEAGFRNLAAQLRAGSAKGVVKSIAFTSPGRREGRTSVVLTLARILGEMGTRVLVVEADFEHPDLAAQLGLIPSAGLWETVSGQAALEPTLERLTRGGISWLPLTAPVSPAELQRGLAHFQYLLRTLREQHDLLLVDAGPASTNPAASPGRAWQRGCIDAVITVSSRQKSEPAADLEAGARHWRQTGIASLGIIETFV